MQSRTGDQPLVVENHCIERVPAHLIPVPVVSARMMIEVIVMTFEEMVQRTSPYLLCWIDLAMTPKKLTDIGQLRRIKIIILALRPSSPGTSTGYWT